VWSRARSSSRWACGSAIIGLLITLVILKITWDSWRTVAGTEPVELHEH
jgi:hypothetical protein